METVTYPYAGKRSVKNNDQARERAKRQLGPQTLISHIGWKHENGDTVCVVEYLTPAEAAAHDRAPNTRTSMAGKECTPAHVHNALLEMGGTATVHDIALALDLDAVWLTRQMERQDWRLEIGASGCFAGELTELTLDTTTAVYIDTPPAVPHRPTLREMPGVMAAAVARSVMRTSRAS
ncbi:hypothetical protein [Kineosporia sp. NBRC 101731]|uniref:hypothetical protein n=1 Tax=Kineosporia sp. NBRC 101731 TaxID=3032199 RepID=UPI0024A15B6A|nr:hypothetical protein [Kineosporia sp. NBRC 101731]GLY29972.1 hypothetical protein Kisp02_33370 [Kineosporia sp. NBRC 101731]